MRSGTAMNPLTHAGSGSQCPSSQFIHRQIRARWNPDLVHIRVHDLAQQIRSCAKSLEKVCFATQRVFVWVAAEIKIPSDIGIPQSSRANAKWYQFQGVSVSLRMKTSKQVRSKRTSQIWRPSQNPADAGSQTWYSSTYLKMNMRPEPCKPSHEAREPSSFKTYLPNLTAFKKSSRGWITDFVVKGFAKKKTTICGQNYVSLRMKLSKQVRSKVPHKSDGLQKIQPTLDHWFGFQGPI